MKKLNWRSLLFVGFLLGLLILGACQGDEETPEEPSDEEEVEQDAGEENEESEGASYPLTITDKTGEEITLEEEPESIISVVPSATEIVFAVGSGDKVIAVDEWSNYPEEVADLERVGDMNLNIEQIVSLEPDVVIADLVNGESIDALREAGLTVVVLGAETIEETYDDLLLAGQATGSIEEAEAVIADMQERIGAIEEQTSELSEEEKKLVWLEIDVELFSAAEGTFMHEILTLAGGRNILEGEKGWPQVSEEIVIESNPDVIITTYGTYVEDVEEQVLSRETWQDVTAIQEEQVYNIDNDLLSRPGPRLVDGLEELFQYLYPDLAE